MTFRGIGNCQITRSELFRHTSKIGQNWRKLAQKRLSPETVRVDPRTEVTCHPYELRDGLGVPRKYLSRIVSSSSLCGAPNPRFKKWLKLAQKRLSPETVRVDPRTEVTCHPYELRDGLGVPRKYLSRILSSSSPCGAPNPRFKEVPKLAEILETSIVTSGKVVYHGSNISAVHFPTIQHPPRPPRVQLRAFCPQKGARPAIRYSRCEKD